ncbi:MAG TPA: MBL fold metallo-hydrolase [Terriglobia bacterium]|nr:MBL fold metallo-hydrolase [Terriglobia bacterium]
MRLRTSFVFVIVACLALFASSLWAQDLGPHFRKIKEGIYVQSAREVDSNVGIILTKEGVVIIDTGQTPIDSREVQEAVKKLTAMPVRLVINTEVHPDHTTGNFVFSPPGIVINHEGASEAMRKAADPNRLSTLSSQSAEMREAAQGYQLVTPHIEYHDKTTVYVGERTFELLHLKNVHSEADTAVWLPNERVLFAASVAIPNSINNIRPFVAIPDMLAATKMLKSLNPEIVVPGHGSFGTTKIFDDSARYYGLLLDRVGALVRAGKSLDQIKQELRMPEYKDWSYQERMPTNIEAAYRAVKGI